MITDHRYDAGWPRDDSKGCIAWATGEPMGMGTLVVRPTKVCGKPEAEHAHSEYPGQRPNREDDYLIPFVSDGEHGTRFPDVGAMHEPAPYTGELDWPPVGVFTD